MSVVERWPDFAPTPATPTPRRLPTTTKLYPPRIRSRLVRRPRLLDLVDGPGGGSLVVIRAPAGYGKSTLVAQWLEHDGTPVAWASLDAGDNDPWTFFSFITAAISALDHDLVSGTLGLLERISALTEQAIIGSLVAELSTATRPFVLVLDDYDVITAPEIHKSVTYLLNHLPPALRVVIVTRSEPPLLLARLRASGEIIELGEPDLRFTQEEALTLFQRTLDLDLTPGEVEALCDRSEGWVAALQLFGLSMHGQPRARLQRIAEETSGNARFVDEYLWEEILQPLPEELRTFLLRTSILDRFNADLCAVVADAGNADEFIRHCDNANLFVIPLDGQGDWYRYHHLFADALRDRLTQDVSEDEATRLHLRAAEWFEEHDLIEEAVRHAVAARDWERTVRLLERIGTALFESDRIGLLHSWLEGLPPQVFDRSPRLTFWFAWTLMRSGDFRRALPLVSHVRDTWMDVGDPVDRGMAQILVGTQHLVTADYRRMAEAMQAALELLPTDRSSDRALAFNGLGIAHFMRGFPDDADRALAGARMAMDGTDLLWANHMEMVNSGGVLIQRGKLQEAEILLQQVVRTGDHRHTPPVQNALYQLGAVYLEWDLLDDAERYLRRAIELAGMTKSTLFGNRVHLWLARLNWARGENEDAVDDLERAMEFARKTGSDQDARHASARQASFWLASNQIALARRWADSSGLDPYLPPEYERLPEHLTFVRLQILDGRPDLALLILNAVQDSAESSGRFGEMVEMLVLRTLAHKAAGDPPSAFEALERALVLGAPAGYVRAFVDEGAAIEPLLRHAATRGSRRDYAQRLLTAIDGGPGLPSPVQTGLVESLSIREVQVLRLVATGLPNRDVGQRLFISEKTVKKHISSIMTKMGTVNRTQAVDQARRLGLL